MAENNTHSSTTGLHRIEALRGTDNYNVWRIQMEDILTDLELYDYVTRKSPKQLPMITKMVPGTIGADGIRSLDYEKSEKNPEYEKWTKNDRRALSNIRLRVDGNVLTHIQSCTYSADAWDLLAATYQVKGTVGLIDLRRKFFSHRMSETDDIEEHIQRMRGWFQQLNQIAPGTCTEVDWITTLVASLPDSWDTFTQSISFQFDASDANILANQISDLRSRILAEAHRRNTRNGEAKSFFSSNKPNHNRSTRTESRAPDKSKSKCNNCGKIGHWAAECRAPGGGAYKRSHQNKSNKGNFHNRRFDSPKKHQNGNARTHIAISGETEDYAFASRYKQTKSISKRKQIWLADSGTTTHIAKERSAFHSYTQATGYITGVAGQEPIVGRGTVLLRCKTGPNKHQYSTIKLTNVAHVPDAPVNLISLSLMTDKGMRISLERDRLTVLSPNNDKVAIGSKLRDRAVGNLWSINAQTISDPQAESEKSNGEIVMFKQKGRTWLEWHKTLGHINVKTLKRLKETNAVDGMEIAEDSEGLNFECNACMQSKAHVQPFPKDSRTVASEIGELVVTDVWGPARIASIGKYKYYVSFTDVATRFTIIAFLRHKDETINGYESFEAMINTQKDKRIKRVRFDNGGEFVNKEWTDHTKLNGTILETTAPYSAQQNGIAERLNRTLAEKARAMMIEASAPKFLWSEAIAYACYLKNRTPTQVNGKFWKTPYELFWNKRPEISRLRPWGAKCYILNQGENVSKLDAKTFTGIFTGISDVQGKSWRYYKTGANRILHSRNVSFPRVYAHDLGTQQDPDWGETVVPPAEGEMSQSDSAAERLKEPTGIGGEHSSKVESESKPSNDSKGKGELKDIKTKVEVVKSPTNSPTSTHSAQTESSTLPSRSTMRFVPRDKSNPELDDIKPLNTRTRRGDPNADLRIMESERGGVKSKPQDPTPTGKAMFTIDSELSNMVTGYAYPTSTCTSDSDTDYESDTDSDDDAIMASTNESSIGSPPTIPTYLDSPSLKPIDLPSYDELAPESPVADSEDDTVPEWALAAQVPSSVDNPSVEQALAGPDADKWKAAMEIETNTLQKMGTFEPVELPKDRKAIGNKARLVAQGFSQAPGIDFGQTFAPVLDVHSAYLNADVDEELYMRQIPYFEDGTNRVLKLKRSLYGLKQAGRMWNKLFDSKLKRIGYQACKTDACVYRRITTRDDQLQVAILAIHVDDIMVATSTNNTDQVISELLREFEMRDLGPIRHFLGINFIRDLESAGLKNAYAAHTPMTPNVQLTRHEGTKPNFNYGMYIAQFTSCFGPTHVTAVKHTIRYLKGTASRGLTYRRSTDGFGEVGYSDADWGSSLLDRKSISGNVFLLGGAAISWSAKKQTTVALSTMEAEYMALSHACTQALWLRQFFEELYYGADAPTLLLSDNLAALTLSVESQYHGRSKHIDIRHHFMRDVIEKRKVSTLYVPSKENLADEFTKALPAPQFSYLTNSVMGEPSAKITEVEVDEA
ncbi:Retrovirus-related Pol polyprotein from transposon TNT 1-94 [Ceratobasidium sp. AG-Ba]|nr:Retrovirus-related Pol polyprotein from transposon TNT 1-94 [Ceratobasidium sp. AG-Ba]